VPPSQGAFEAIAALAAFAAVFGCRGSRGDLLADAGLSDAQASVADAFLTLDGNGAGYALSFDGAKDYATAANAQFPAAGANQTVEMWVDFASTAGTQNFLTMRLDQESGVQIGFRNGALAVWRVYVDRVLVTAPTTPPAGTWHHVAYSYDTNTHVLYVDGTVVDRETVPGDTRTPTTAWLGTSDGSSQLYRGQMDEVRVWQVTRTASQVAADMGHNQPGPIEGLVAYWTFDDADSGGRALDASGTGNTVTLGDGVAEDMPTRVPSSAPVGR
jgi:concanavalin A-like lectin/glucanase superfamily protein